MSYTIINTKLIATGIYENVKIKGKTLAVFAATEDPGIESYERSILLNFSMLGATVELKHYGTNSITSEEFLSQIEAAGKNPKVDGILVLRPFPDGVTLESIKKVLPNEKDLDSLNFAWIEAKEHGRSVEGTFPPCVCTAIIHLFDSCDVELKSKKVGIVNGSRGLGMPLAIMFAEKGADVTVISKEQGNVDEDLKDKDIVITAAGKAGLITGKMLKDGVVLIDLGVNQKVINEHGRDRKKMVGDIAESCLDKASLISSASLRNGVGPITTAMLAMNLSKTN